MTEVLHLNKPIDPVMLEVMIDTVLHGDTRDRVLFEVKAKVWFNITSPKLTVIACGVGFSVFGFIGSKVQPNRWPAYACGDLKAVNTLVNKASDEVTDLKIQVNSMATRCEGNRTR